MPTCLVILFTIMPYGAIMAYIASYGINQGIENIGLYFSMYALSLFVVGWELDGYQIVMG
ncbi:hypothetical protein [Oenococcus oeni]|uniref:hypothetical protein n=1 Tax=Oenococcus oeni TaxID=1247 RepID=UPI001C5D15AB|nr:hypothetical protein [Oenococcus oeni]